MPQGRLGVGCALPYSVGVVPFEVTSCEEPKRSIVTHILEPDEGPRR
jgi:hypothetical protein